MRAVLLIRRKQCRTQCFLTVLRSERAISENNMLSLQRDYLKILYNINNNTVCATASHCCKTITLLAFNIGTNSLKCTPLLINKYVFTTHNELPLRRPHDTTSSGPTAARATSFPRVTRPTSAQRFLRTSQHL